MFFWAMPFETKKDPKKQVTTARHDRHLAAGTLGATTEAVEELMRDATSMPAGMWLDLHSKAAAALDRDAERLPSIDPSIGGGLIASAPLGVPSGHPEGGSEGVLLPIDLLYSAFFRLL